MGAGIWYPLVALGFVIERVNQLPLIGRLTRHKARIAIVVLLVALISFVVWGSERAPQRLTLADLAAGALAPSQSWIIVSGELREEPLNVGYRYRLTDPAAPNARMVVFSDVELPTGPATISGTYIGNREGAPPGFNWAGAMRADPVLAPDQSPPWLAIILVASALLVGLAGRIGYPLFVVERPRSKSYSPASLRVTIRRMTSTSGGEFAPATLRIEPGEPAMLRSTDAAAVPVRLHSALAGVEVGKLIRLSGSEPALRVRQASGDLELRFASPNERDAAFAALVADVEGARRLAPTAPTTR
jgi:hypothetical protein